MPINPSCPKWRKLDAFGHSQVSVQHFATVAHSNWADASDVVKGEGRVSAPTCATTAHMGNILDVQMAPCWPLFGLLQIIFP